MSETNDDPVVGHKTYRDANGTRHEPLRESEAKAIMARVEAATAKRKVDMPTEQDAIRALWSAHQRLKELGWREGLYMPTTGEQFATVQVGSTGIHACTAERRNTFDIIYTTHDGDLWPSSQPPTLFRPWRDTDVQQDNGICAPLPPPDGVETGEPRGPVHSCKNCAHLAKDSCDDPCAGCTVRWRSGVSDRWEPAPGMGPSAGARPLSEWHEDDGPVTWWKFPVDEPAWIGTPNSSDWPGYHTHWTPHPPMPLGVSVACREPSTPSPTDGSAKDNQALRTLARLSDEMGEEL